MLSVGRMGSRSMSQRGTRRIGQRHFHPCVRFRLTSLSDLELPGQALFENRQVAAEQRLLSSPLPPAGQDEGESNPLSETV
jgi:hypothetical protein